jgi:hypothetical protein
MEIEPRTRATSFSNRLVVPGLAIDSLASSEGMPNSVETDWTVGAADKPATAETE